MKNINKLQQCLFAGSCVFYLLEPTNSFAMEANNPMFDDDKKMFYYGRPLRDLSRLQGSLSADIESLEQGIIYPIIDGSSSIGESSGEEEGGENKRKIEKKYKNDESILKERDRRRIVSNPQEYPWCVRGQLIMTYFDKNPTEDPSEYVGSGTLIEDQYVLTAAHNLYDHKKGVPDRITFFLGLHGTDNYIAQSSVSHAAITYEYARSLEKEDKKNADIGLVKLKTPIRFSHPFPKIHILEDDNLINTPITVAGYPGMDYMFFMKGRINDLDQHRMFYDVDTKRGQSGSGVLLEDGEENYLIGVHAYGAKREKHGNLDKDSKEYKYNSATRINENKVNLIEEWKKYFSNI